MIRKQNSQCGLTLLELLVAMVLMALVAVMLSDGLRFGIRAWEVSDVRTTEINRLRIVQSVIRRQVAQARPVVRIRRKSNERVGSGVRPGVGPGVRPGVRLKEKSRIDFTGEADRVEFVAPMPPHLGLGGFAKVTLYGSGDGEGQKLAMIWQPYDSGFNNRMSETGFREDVVLLDGIKSMAFSYYGRKDRHSEPDWTDNWTDRDQLPQLLRLKVRIGEDSGRAWPDLIVRIAIQKTSVR